MEGNVTAFNGEESSTAITEVEPQKTKLDNEYNLIDGVWTNSYKKISETLVADNEKPVYEQVNNIIPKSEVPDEVIKKEEERTALDKNEGGAFNFVFGEDDVDFMDSSVMDNYNSFLPSNDESKVIKTQANTEIETYNNNIKAIEGFNVDVLKLDEPTPTQTFPSRMPMGPEGQQSDTQITVAKQLQNLNNQKLLNPDIQILLDKKKRLQLDNNASRVSKFLSDAEKLWPKNEPKSKMTEMSIDTGKKDASGNTVLTSWLDQTASALMQKSDEDNLFEKNVAAYLEAKQGVGEVTDTKEQVLERKKAKVKIKEWIF